jgi:uncharacterized protein YbbK (DUF523 family)
VKGYRRETYGGAEYLVSACLAGVRCRYDGGSCPNRAIEELVERGEAVAVCPELLGRLEVPREPCEIRADGHGGVEVVTRSGCDCTRQFKRGARKTLRIVQSLHIGKAILKSRSPSCGFGTIHDGKFSGALINGNGVTATLLHRKGIRIYTEKQVGFLVEQGGRL